MAYTGGPMRVAGWKFPVIVDLAGLDIPSQNRPIRFSHDPSAAGGVGHSDAVRVEAGQLIATGVVSRDTPAAKEVVVSSKNGFPWQASINASVDQFEFIAENKQVIVNGRTFDGPVNVVRKATLGEISFVDLGADGKTSAQIAASQTTSQQESSHMTVQATQSTQSDTKIPGATAAEQPASTVTSAAAPAAGTAAAPAPTVTAAAAPGGGEQHTADQIRAAALAETTRITSIRRICAAKHGDVEAKAIGEGWDATKTELEVLRASRPHGPLPGAPMAFVPNLTAEQTASSTMLEAACLLTAKLDNIDKLFDEQTLDAASKRFRGGIGLQELLMEAAWANGYSGRNFRDPRNVLRCAFGLDGPMALTASGGGGGMSTIDIGGILSNVANKFLLDGFFSVERVWRNICAVRNVSDFKTVTSYRLIGNDQYEKVAPSGELKHGTLGNETYTNKADTYGLMLGIDRRDMINDDLGAITTVPRKLGRGSGLKINDVFWTMFLANSGGAFFSSGNKNYLTGTDTVLTIDGLTKAEVAFLEQVDGDGKPIGVMPAIVLVPTALSAVGTQLYKSVELRDTTAGTKYPVANPHQGKFRVEVSRYLANSQYTGNSSKAWYLLADPSDLPVIEVAFLNGQESPTIGDC
ncbi:MAG: phage major capsid protein [Phycisphaerales bacterium]